MLGVNVADKTLDNLSPVGGDSGNGGVNFNNYMQETTLQYGNEEKSLLMKKKGKKITSRH